MIIANPRSTALVAISIVGARRGPQSKKAGGACGDVSHLNAVFILGRAVMKANTTFLWASGAPVVLLPDAWNVRLIPHYSLGVWFLIAHMRLGVRGVLLAHRVSPLAAGRVKRSI